jgi:hypothetical protein
MRRLLSTGCVLAIGLVRSTDCSIVSGCYFEVCMVQLFLASLR